MISQPDGGPDATAPSRAAAPTLSIVIVSWNDWAKLEKCLTSIYRNALPAVEVLVIDNASSDGTPEHLRMRFPSVDLHCNTRNVGHSKAVNYGFAWARGDFILLLDQDTELMADCVNRLLDFLHRHPEADLVAPRTFNTNGTIQQTVRNFPSALSGLFGRQSTLTRWFPSNPISRRYLAGQFLDATEPFEVEQAGGACMLFHRRLLSQVGLWDERYFAYWNDTDWCYRLRAAGKRIFCIPAAEIVHHETSARNKGKRPSRIWMFHHNAYRLYTRWQTLGYWDPRSVLAGVALLGRALLLIAYHGMKRRRSEMPSPLLDGGAVQSEPSGTGAVRR
jgi:N-acetylglucosaminyl-diphospho-decaprenol L-rhamnosyltransferase